MIDCAIATSEDMAEILDIELNYNPQPWDEKTFAYYLQDGSCLIARIDGAVVGYMVITIKRNRVTIQHFLLVNGWEQKGLLGTLIDDLFRRQRMYDFKSIKILVRLKKTNVLNTFKSKGFKAVSLLENHFSDPEDDAVRMIHRGENSWRKD